MKKYKCGYRDIWLANWKRAKGFRARIFNDFRYIQAKECPIALCLRRNGHDVNRVGRQQVEIKGEKYPLPYDVCHFITLWDMERKVKPFEFEMDLPDA